jgi:uncharacterized membrane protein YvbJ
VAPCICQKCGRQNDCGDDICEVCQCDVDASLVDGNKLTPETAYELARSRTPRPNMVFETFKVDAPL